MQINMKIIILMLLVSTACAQKTYGVSIDHNKIYCERSLTKIARIPGDERCYKFANGTSAYITCNTTGIYEYTCADEGCSNCRQEFTPHPVRILNDRDITPKSHICFSQGAAEKFYHGNTEIYYMCHYGYMLGLDICIDISYGGCINEMLKLALIGSQSMTSPCAEHVYYACVVPSTFSHISQAMYSPALANLQPSPPV
jgi:hypothetical protein